jgi:hypothetical protein
MNGEFYVGYQPRAPRELGRLMRRSVLALLALAGATGALLTFSQGRFDSGEFAYLDYQPRTGPVRLRPYPRLGDYWLAGQGKHQADEEALRAVGPAASLRGALIAHPAGRMLEVEPGSVRPSAAGAEPLRDEELGAIEVTGEIVDTKCFLGVMKPGRGKVHRACATRCLSGGIPAGLLVTGATGDSRVLFLAGEDERPLSREVAHMAGERITARGILVRSGASLILRTEPRRFLRE